MFFLFRYKLLLNEEQKGLAIAHLSKIWSHMKSLSACTEGDSVPSISAQNNLREEAEGDQDECTDPVELMLRQRESERRQSSAERSGETPLKDLLESYYNEERIDKKSNVLMYWESQKNKKTRIIFVVSSCACSARNASFGRKSIFRLKIHSVRLAIKFVG